MPISRIGTDGIENGAIAIADLAATGTPGVTTFLRGDNTWSSTMTSGTAVTASGTSVDFTGIPAGVKRVTVMFSGVSTNGTSVIQVQLGDSGGVENTGYLSTSSTAGGSLTAITSGFAVCTPAAASVVSGHCVLTLINTANTWVQTSLVKSATNTMAFSAGDKATSATLDRVRITTVNGTDTFDAGTINLLWE